MVKLGIGTNNPSDIFTVKKDGANQILARFTTDLGTNNGRAITLSTPRSDSASLPFVFHTGNAYEFKVDTITGLFIDDAGKVGIGTDPSNILHIKSANPVLTIQDTETGLSSADSRIRLAESNGSGGVENYWDIKAGSFYSNWSFDVQSSGSNTPTVNMAQTGNIIGINTGSAAGYQVRVRGANLGELLVIHHIN